MSTTAPRTRAGKRGAPDDGPRATFRQLLPYLLEHKKVLSWVVLISIVGAAASLAQPVLVSQVIAAVQSGDTLGNLVGVLIVLVVVSGLLSGFQHYLLQRTGTSVVLSARRRLVQRMLLFIGALIAMFIIDPVLLGLTALVIAVSIVGVVVLSGRIRAASQQQQEKVGDLAASVERALSAIRTVRAAGATERETSAIDRQAVGAWKMGIRVAKVSSLVVPIAGIAMQVSLLTVLGVGGFRVANGDITVASLVSFILFLFMIIMPLGTAFGAVTSVNQALGALGRIQEIIDLPSEDETDAAIAPAADVPTTDAITFQDVEFRYPEGAVPPGTAATSAVAGISLSSGDSIGDTTERDRTVLRGVSFSVPRGHRIALVGPSGAGKSTILALIERFYDPTGGTVRLGGRDIRSLDRTALRAHIGYVEQDAPVLAGTIRDNLTLGAPDASDNECMSVLRSVNLMSVFDRDERGLDAQVGEDGVMLSGGERQRLAIARTLLSAPPILLLDESTSSLDGLNEQLLREAIDAVAQDRTLIVIAHRLSTVVDSDQIVVLEDGRVVGVGTHSELVASTPLYKELAKHQLLV
jgi:ABC-type multidrug transport system fused ATPase/permease subunit